MVEVTKEIYDSEPKIIQPHAPGLPGFVCKTEEEANTYADEVIYRILTTGIYM